jgi:hypothetical protein
VEYRVKGQIAKGNKLNLISRRFGSLHVCIRESTTEAVFVWMAKHYKDTFAHDCRIPAEAVEKSPLVARILR